MTGLLLLMLAIQGAPTARPDFSGMWVINPAASDFGVIPPPQCRGFSLKHTEPELIAEETRPDGSACGVVIRYTTDGAPVSYTTNNTRMTARLRWDGNHLVIDRTSPDGVEMHIDASLSADGRTLTRTFHVESNQGAADWIYVYDRAR